MVTAYDYPGARHAEGAKRVSLGREILRLPPAWAVFAALAVNLLGLPVPERAITTLRYVGDAYDVAVRSGQAQGSGLRSRPLMPDVRLPLLLFATLAVPASAGAAGDDQRRPARAGRETVTEVTIQSRLVIRIPRVPVGRAPMPAAASAATSSGRRPWAMTLPASVPAKTGTPASKARCTMA